jgi:hypothetical protein
MSIANESKPAPGGWATSSALTSDHIWDSFLLLTLLEDHQTQRTTLSVPHGGDRRSRFTEAIRARNMRIKLFGQEELRHYCDKCTRKYKNAEGDGESWYLCLPHISLISTTLQIALYPWL